MNNSVGIPLNCGTPVSEPTYIFKKPSMGGEFFQLIVDPIIHTISSSSSGVITQNDIILVQTSGSTTITDYQVNLQQLIPGTYDVSIYSNNSGVILGSNAGSIASGVSAGSTALVAISSDNSFSSANVIVTGVVGTLNTSFSDYVSDSLAKEVVNSVDNRISGLNASTAKPIFSTQNHNTSTYVRNSGCWVNDLDLTPISPWNATGADTRAGTLISPRHIIFAAHYQINNGATIRFVDTNNNVVTRTMVNKLTHPNYSPLYPDLAVGVLDSDVPPDTINFVKILPQNWNDYLPSLSSLYRLPCLVLDKEEKALISELRSLSTTARFSAPSNSTRLAFFENIVRGDSGNPAFLLIDDELVIITVWTYGGVGGGTSILFHKDAINTMMATLGGGYSLTEIDLSGFTDYS